MNNLHPSAALLRLTLVATLTAGMIGCASSGTESTGAQSGTTSGSNGAEQFANNDDPNTQPTNAQNLTVPVQGAFDGSNFARTQQRLNQHPVFQFFASRGDSHDFSTQAASDFRQYLSGSMVIVSNATTDIDSLNTQTFTRHMVFCPGGELVMAASFEDSFFNPDIPSDQNPFIGSESTTVFQGYWDVSTFSGFSEENGLVNGLMITNMVDVREALIQQAASQGISVPFPSPGQADVVFDRYVLTGNGEALQVEDIFWVLVDQVTPNGIVQLGADELSPRSAAPILCG